MANILKPLINTKNIINQTKPIKRDIAQVNLVASGIKISLSKRNKFKRESISKFKFFQNKRDQQVRRKEREDILESSGIAGATRRIQTIAAQSTRGFLGRILDFVGTLLVGWLVNNLPSIFTMATELIARIRKMFSLLVEFSQNLVDTFFNFGQLLGSVYRNISNFDFFDTSGRVKQSLEDLQNNFLMMEQQFDEASKLFTTSLAEGLIGGEDAAPFGTDYTQVPGTAGTGGRLQPIHKQALDIISGPESGGDYNAMNNGQPGDRPGGAKKWLGKNLTDMTIGEVKNYQNNKKTLWAAGRYQFVPVSLPVAQKGAGLKDTDKFDQNNQDLMAIALLKIQGPGAWTKYSSYTKEEIDIMYRAKDTPLATPPPRPISPTPNIPTTVIDEINVSGPSGGTPSVGLTPGQGFGVPREGNRSHAGIDIGTSGQRGYYVSFRKSGRVDFAGVAGGYGNTVDIITSDGTCYRFSHLASIFVRSGQNYNGQTIGEIGKSGSASGIHLHYEVRPGGPYENPIDPRPYLNLLSIGRKLTGQPKKASQQTAQVTPFSAASPVSGNLSTINQSLIPSSQEPPKISSRATYSTNEIKTQRSSQKIIIIDDVQQTTPQVISGGGSEPPPIIVVQDSLNSFIKSKLFLDLAYT